MTIAPDNLTSVVDVDIDVPAPTPTPPRGPLVNTPRVFLVVLDATAIALAWSLGLIIGHGALGFAWEYSLRSWATVGISVALTWFLLAAFDLYKSRVSSVRSAELAAISRVAALVIPGILFFDLLASDTLHIGVDLMVGLSLFAFLIVGRSIFDGWIRTARSAGRFCRSVVIVGGGRGTTELEEMLNDHVEAGYRVKGVVGPRGIENPSASWLGPTNDILDAMASVDANGAFVVVDELTPAQRSFVIERLTGAGHHVHLTMGIAGISSQRVQLAPVVHEPLLYVDRVSLKRWQLLAKRALDVLLATLGLLVTFPFLAMAAFVVKLQDRGPVFFKQERVGLDGEPFVLWKLRTMAVDAEDRLHEVEEHNVRQGPLLKVERDPRVTRFGHLLRFTSIDELPQLWNVLLGDMSLVGPRPALPEEVALFDDELLERHNVHPGITGLWQVEARDNPSFSSYRRLDLFYVKNWSITLDLVILILTGQSVLARAIKGLFSRNDDPSLS